MTDIDLAHAPPWHIAAIAAALFAVDPARCGGVFVRAGAGPTRDAWLAMLRALLPPTEQWRRAPANVTDARLLGGLDLAVTLAAGRAVAERGLLADADGGVLVVPMAERLSAAVAARMVAVLDVGEVQLERDGLSARHSSRFGLVALDEGASDEERAPAALLDRLAFHLQLDGIAARACEPCAFCLEDVIAARDSLPAIAVSNETIEALCGAGLALGIASLRAPWFAVQVARIAAALAGRDALGEADVAIAAALVLAPRATRMPQMDERNENPEREPPSREHSEPDSPEDTSSAEQRPLEEVAVAAARAVLPADLLAQLRTGTRARARAPSEGRADVKQTSRLRGRPAGTQRGEPCGGARLNVIETLRAAAPWQRLRHQARCGDPARGLRVQVRRDDFRVTRFKRRPATTTVFAVDASGSTALHRLAEAKGAVELLLADCYVRRDRVALIAFRGRGAELLVSPTRSLTRARRCLASLPGGGGTPLASGIDAATALAEGLRRRGDVPIVVVMTDGRANVARSGATGRVGETDALLAARDFRAASLTALLIDTAPRPQAMARQLAVAMDARYLALPHADAFELSRAVRAAQLR